MALVNGTNYDHIDLQAAAGGDVTRHKLQDTDGRALVAPTEASSTASAAHAAGTYFILGGVLYKATANIAQGGSIVTSGTGQNCEAVTVAGEVSKTNGAVSDLKSAVDGIIDKNYSANILNPDTIVNGKTFNNTGLVYNAELYFIAGPYPVSSGEKIYLWAQVGSYYANVEGKLLFSDDGGNVVADGYVTTQTDYNGNTGYSVPSGATQVKVSAYASYYKKAVTKEKITAYVPYSATSILSETLVKNSGIPYKSESLLYSEPQTLTSEQKQQGRENLGIVDAEPPDYTGKKVLFLGDSITRYNFEDNGWCKYFNQLMQPAKTVNIAVSGAVWSDYSNTVYDGNPDTNLQQNNTICNQVEKILRGKDSTNPNYSPVADYADFDIIIIAAGTNDSPSKFSEDNIKPTFVDNSLGYTVLVAVDDIDRKNACGAMRYAYEKLYRVYPNAHFYYCTPIQTYPTKKNWGETLNKGDVIKAMCRYLPVHAIDTEKCGIYGWHEQYNSMGVDLIDGLHPSESGAVKIGTYNANAVIKTYIPY